jgi:hypothetical protein
VKEDMASRINSSGETLKRDLNAAGLSDLADSIDTIMRAVVAHWHVPHLWWFTDHTAEHSRRVAGYCDLLYLVRPMHKEFELNIVERYILFAAAWIHDIGMQGSAETDNEAITEAIRKTHPARSHDLLIEGAFLLGFSNDVLLEAIAMVAKAHGTAYYRDSVATMPPVLTVADHPVRLPLLAALLLMADELDLHNDRAKLQQIDMTLKPLTAAHWLKHQFVASVSLGVDAEGDVEITLETAQHRNLSNDDAAEVLKWIVSKLQTQMGMVDPEIRRGFGGQFSFARRVRVKRIKLGTASKLVSREALAIVRSENATSDLINYKLQRETALKAALKSRESIEIRGRTGANDSDIDGREDFLSAIVSALEVSGVVIARRWDQLSITATPADVLESWAIDLGYEPDEGSDEEIENVRRSELLGTLISSAKEETAPIVFVLSGLDLMAESDRKWLVEVAFEQLQNIDNVSLIISTTPSLGIPATKATWHRVELGVLKDEDKASFLGRILNDHRSAARAAVASETYLSVKKYADETAILLEP